jgi:hypothetical protein
VCCVQLLLAACAVCMWVPVVVRVQSHVAVRLLVRLQALCRVVHWVAVVGLLPASVALVVRALERWVCVPVRMMHPTRKQPGTFSWLCWPTKCCCSLDTPAAPRGACSAAASAFQRPLWHLVP